MLVMQLQHACVSYALRGAPPAQVGQAMCAEGADKAAFQNMLGPFARKLTSPTASAREVAVAVEAVGEFAPATCRFFGEQVRAQHPALGTRLLLSHVTIDIS